MTTPFDHRPDTELGAALRELLNAPHDEAFVTRVLAARDAMLGSEAGWWSVLTQWAKPGLAAAAGLMLAAALWLGRGQQGANGASLADPLTAAGEQLALPLMVGGQQEPDVDVVLAVALER
jgi:hypothetical protein